jgi:hypothetical protein
MNELYSHMYLQAIKCTLPTLVQCNSITINLILALDLNFGRVHVVKFKLKGNSTCLPFHFKVGPLNLFGIPHNTPLLSPLP